MASMVENVPRPKSIISARTPLGKLNYSAPQTSNWWIGEGGSLAALSPRTPLQPRPFRPRCVHSEINPSYGLVYGLDVLPVNRQGQPYVFANNLIVNLIGIHVNVDACFCQSEVIVFLSGKYL